MCAGEYGGLKLTANARAALMQRLSGAPGGTGANTMPLGVPGMALPGQHSCLKLQGRSPLARVPPSIPSFRMFLATCSCSSVWQTRLSGTDDRCMRAGQQGGPVRGVAAPQMLRACCASHAGPPPMVPAGGCGDERGRASAGAGAGHPGAGLAHPHAVPAPQKHVRPRRVRRRPSPLTLLPCRPCMEYPRQIRPCQACSTPCIMTEVA